MKCLITLLLTICSYNINAQNFMGINVNNLEYNVNQKYGEGTYTYINRFYSPIMIRDFYNNEDIETLIDDVNHKEDYVKFLHLINNNTITGKTIDEIEELAGAPIVECKEGNYSVLEYIIGYQKKVRIYIEDGKVSSIAKTIN